MKILAVETSCDMLSVSLLEGKELILELKSDSPRSHSETLMIAIDSLLKRTNTSLEDIDLFACDNGPGSFTGIRIGVATVKAIGDVTVTPCIAISSLEALAYTCKEDGYICSMIDGLSTIKAFCDAKDKPCISVSALEALAYTVNEDTCYICSMIDAKHSNIYAGMFELKRGVYAKIKDFKFCNVSDFLESLSKVRKKIFFVGNCGILYKDMIKSYMKCEYSILEDNIPTSEYIGIVAFDKYEDKLFENSPELSALYLKNSSAEDKV